MPYFEKYNCVYLEAGAIYDWSGIKITKMISIYGRGAIVRLSGDGPIIEVTGGLNDTPSNIPMTIYDVNFDGNEVVDRNVQMSAAFLNRSAIWCTNAWKSSIINCTFSNFNGTAIWYRDNTLASTVGFQQEHLLLGCKFLKCRIGVSNSGRSEYSLANSNTFYDCCVCFNVIGGNWRRTANQIKYSKCAYLHVEAGMWYEGSNKQNAAHGSFTSNTLNHCDDGCKWPAVFTLADGRPIGRLSGMYFDSSVSYPPTFTGNTLWYSGIELRGFRTDPNLKCYCFTGCTFMGKPTDPTSSRIAIAAAKKNLVFFIGCTGNNLNVYNGVVANMTPPFGNVLAGNYDSQYPLPNRMDTR
nr:MAG: IX protein [unidentified adenovirus]